MENNFKTKIPLHMLKKLQFSKKKKKNHTEKCVVSLGKGVDL